jgi:UDP-2,3-diacylglucosamine pyrophosphatase LpxH
MTKDVSYLTISDIHLGHNKNRTSEIIKNLDEYFDNYSNSSQFANLDIIFIAGDMFDRLINASGTEIGEILLWIERLMSFCKRHDIILRILRGTPSHDWEMPKLLETVFAISKIDIDFKHVDTLHIEVIDKLGLSILYVPDEWHPDPNETAKQVTALMEELHMTQVDIAIMHGNFPHQLPTAAHNVPKHDPGFYLSIVRYFINIGHIHIFSVYERILAQGSFDRISHGEENPKGGIVCHLSTTGNSFVFVENKLAKIFKSVTLKSKDIDKSFKQMDKELAKIPNNSHVKIKANKDHPLYVAFEELKLRYPMFFFTKASLEDEEEAESVVNNSVSLDQTYSPIHINRGNIVSLILDEIKTKYNLDTEKLTLLEETLESNK